MNTRNQILRALKAHHKMAFENGDDWLMAALDVAIAFAQGRSDDDVLMIMGSHGLIIDEPEVETKDENDD